MQLGRSLAAELGGVVPAGRELLRRNPKLPSLQAFRYAAGLSQDSAAARYNEVTEHKTYIGGTHVNSWEAWQRGGVGGACPKISDLVILGIAYGRRNGDTPGSPVSPRDLLGSTFKRMSAEDQVAINEIGDQTATGAKPPSTPAIVLEHPALEVHPPSQLIAGSVGLEVGSSEGPPEVPEYLTADGATAFTPDVERALSRVIDNGAEIANLFGSRQLVEMAWRNTQIIHRLQRTTKGPAHSRLVLLGSRFAEFLSWIYEEIECGTASAQWLSQALDWAMEADDEAMTSYVLARKSHSAVREGDWEKARSFASRASRNTDAPPKVRAFALQQKARALARLDEGTEALKLFDLAQNLAAEGGDNPDYVQYCGPNYIELQRAASWAAMGDAQRGANELTTALSALDPAFRTDRAVFSGRRAQALALAGEPEEAVITAREALALAYDTKCTRALYEISSALKLLDGPRASSDVEQLKREYVIVRKAVTI
jgi:hypothetical protein